MNSYLIGITGGSASGKTYFVRALEKRFGMEEVCFLSQDNYYHPIERQLTDAQGMVNFDLPSSIDDEQLFLDLQALRLGKAISRKEYTFNNPAARPQTITCHPAPVTIVEGLFLMHFNKIKSLLDLSIYIDSKEELKLQRRLQRDMKERGIPEKDILYQWHEHVLPAQQKYLEPYREEADIIITNNVSIEKGLELVSGFLRSILTGFK